MKKALRIARKILVILLMIFTFTVMFFTVLSFTSFNNQQGVLGYQFFVVLSDSMSGVFDVGDVVVSKTVDPVELEAGDIITFKSIDPAFYDLVVTHQIHEVTTYEGELAFETKGVATGAVDASPVPADNVLGQYRFRIPSAGYVFDFIRSSTGYLILILLPFTVLLVLLTIRFIRLYKVYRREKQEEVLDAQKELDEEKKRSLKALAEMEYLKARLQQLESGVPVEDLPKSPETIEDSKEADEPDILKEPEVIETPEVTEMPEVGTSEAPTDSDEPKRRKDKGSSKKSKNADVSSVPEKSLETVAETQTPATSVALPVEPLVFDTQDDEVLSETLQDKPSFDDKRTDTKVPFRSSLPDVASLLTFSHESGEDVNDQDQ